MSANILLLAGLLALGPSSYFTIEVVDDQTGRGVPLVELRTVHGLSLVTDSHGLAAFHEPGLMGQDVFFHVRSHGYEFAKDGFGYRGKALRVIEGGSARLPIHRINVTERLYRVTGAGIYRDSVLLGRPTPLRKPLLNGQVLGSDSVVSVDYRGKLRWFWGDTNRSKYPLGLFQVPGATSLLPGKGGLDPSDGVDLDYFVGKDGFVRAMAQMPGDGPTWIDSLVVLKDSSGEDRMFAAYVKIRKMLEVYERGLVSWDDANDRFEKLVAFPGLPHVYPGGHPFVHKVDGTEYLYFPMPYPLTRVRADLESFRDLARYECFTCLTPGSTVENARVERAGDGLPRYGWKRGALAIAPGDQSKLLKRGELKPEDALIHLQDAETGKTVLAHGSSVDWNEYRKRWVMITVESFGSSMLGEVWFAEADTPLGPWVYARKVATHEKYSFYNPKQHPAFAQDGGRTIYFEGTYTQTFSGNTESTPLYEYNQVMYRLDLGDERVNMPVPVYRRDDPGKGKGFATGRGADVPASSARVAFFALDHPSSRSVPLGFKDDPKGGRRLVILDRAAPEASRAAFHALPAELDDPPATTALLFEYVAKDGMSLYSLDPELADPSLQRSVRPVCRVWKDPLRFALPPG
ncbi:hypothetical protein ACYOEI_09075 [Singulisphaera rosea]